jgi:hypothetical protein
VGSSSQRAALRRQDRFLADKVVLDRRIELAPPESGGQPSFVATIEPTPEVLRPFDADEIAAIHENAGLINGLAERLLGETAFEVTPESVDALFAAWAHSPQRGDISNEFIVQVLGAAFGQYCARELKMTWVVITDAAGATAAIQGAEKQFRSFPFHAIWKRIHDAEQDFFVPIFRSLQNMSSSPDIAASAT